LKALEVVVVKALRCEVDSCKWISENGDGWAARASNLWPSTIYEPGDAAAMEVQGYHKAPNTINNNNP
jgi:hypothetical protein